jgi:hypothetical protein
MSLKRIALAICACAPALAQNTFEVASVRPHQPDRSGWLTVRFSVRRALPIRGDRFTEANASITDLLMDAYDIEDFRIIGVPAWAQAPRERFDIEAKAAVVPTQDELRQMLQALLADRFQIKLHHESRPLPVYALVPAKGGPKLRKAADDSGTTIPMLVRTISSGVDRPVVDATGLTGNYELPKIDWVQFARAKHGDTDAASEGSIFSVIQQELGLKLEPRKDPLDVVVIDRAERPTAN